MKTHIILASSSPRRLEIIHALALPVTVIPPRHDERQMIPNETAEDYAVNLAVEKVIQITNQFPDSAGSVIVGADTVVELDGKIYGKPATSLEAVEMLRSLRGRTHRVVTGVAVTGSSPIHFLTSFRETYVLMRQYADAEIEEYVASGEPMDKAGGYAVQDEHFHAAQWVQGCYSNVVGLPVCDLVDLLDKSGIHIVPSEVRCLPVLEGCQNCDLWTVKERLSL